MIAHDVTVGASTLPSLLGFILNYKEMGEYNNNNNNNNIIVNAISLSNFSSTRDT